MNEIIKGMGFHHIALEANNLEETLKFYKALGMKEISRWGTPEKTIVMLDVGDGGIIEIFSDGSDEKFAELGKWVHFALKVDDVESAYEAALKSGGESVTPPKTVPLDAIPEKKTIHIAFVKGPSGEQVEFFKYI
jgi:catechol 2,3-dioxygenase-like lactoylglutathione lyase family enzyme